MKSQPHQLLSLCLLIVLMVFLSRESHAQNINDGFQADTNDSILDIAVQENGQIIVAGRFTEILGQPRSSIAKLFADGSLDFGFNPSIEGDVFDVAVQNDGKIIIAGNFSEVNGIARKSIARLTPNGLLDISFLPLVNSAVYDIHLQSDGKVLLGGTFTQINGLLTNRIARLLPDGDLDSNFNPGTGADGHVYAIGIQSNGKIIIGGSFSALDGHPVSRMGRLLPNGAVDVNFNDATTSDGPVFSLVVKGDDTILVGGNFQQIAGQNQAFLAKFNRSGLFDASFTPNLDEPVHDLHLKKDGKVLVAGAFTQYDGNSLVGMVQLNPNGQLDGYFASQSQEPLIDPFYKISTVAVQADDKILIGGGFNQVLGIDRSNLARLYPNGQLDKTLNPVVFIGDYVNAIAYDATGSSYIGGQFEIINTEPHENIAKLTPDGFVDSSFNTNINGEVNTIVVSNVFRRLLIGGDFSFADGLAANNIMMTTLSGIRDNSFNAFTDGEVNVILELANGRYMIGGSFDNVSGFARKNLAVINSDGSVVADFTADTNAVVNSLVLQDQGRVIVGGAFDVIKGVQRNGMARLLLVGDLGLVDTFNPNAENSTGSAVIYAMQFQADGKLLVSGSFSSINNVARDGLAGLIIDNSADNVAVDGLNLPLNASGIITSMASAANGGVIVSGNFNSIDGIDRENIARINGNQQVDLGFEADVNQAVTGMALMPDGKIMLGGPFTQINNTGRVHLARMSQFAASIKTFKLKHLEKLPAANRWQLAWKLQGNHPQVSTPPTVDAIFNDIFQETMTMTWNADANQWELLFSTDAGSLPVSAEFKLNTQFSSGLFNRSQSLLRDSIQMKLVEDIIFEDGFENLAIQ